MSYPPTPIKVKPTNPFMMSTPDSPTKSLSAKKFFDNLNKIVEDANKEEKPKTLLVLN